MEFIDNKTIEDFSRDGAVLCKGMFIDWLDELRIGVDKLIENPPPYTAYTPCKGLYRAPAAGQGSKCNI